MLFLSDGEWNRGLIVDQKGNDAIFSVYFIDFGNTELVDGAKIKDIVDPIDVSFRPATAAKCKVQTSNLNMSDVHHIISNALNGQYTLDFQVLSKKENVYYIHLNGSTF
jgi:hypothetical protein